METKPTRNSERARKLYPGHAQAEHHFTFGVGGGVTPLAGRISHRVDNGWDFGVNMGINITSSLASSLGCRYNGLGLGRDVVATSWKSSHLIV